MRVVKERSGWFSWLPPLTAWLVPPAGGTNRVVLAEALVCRAASAAAAMIAAAGSEVMSLRMGSP